MYLVLAMDSKTVLVYNIMEIGKLNATGLDILGLAIIVSDLSGLRVRGVSD